MRVSVRPVVSLLAAMLLAAALLPSATATAQEDEGTVGRVDVDRISGSSRILTAVAVSEATFSSAETVVISRADQFADALVGAVVAAENDAPILLVNSTSLPPEVLAEIARLGATDVIILGGTSAVSAEVEVELGQTTTVRRIEGISRFDTAAAAAAEAPDQSTVFVAAGGDFPDALSAAPYAAFLGNPIVLTGTDELPTPTRDQLVRSAPDEIVVLGGVNAVSDAVVTELETLADSVRRIAGASRWETSAAIYDDAIAAGMSDATRWLATGQNFPDALAAGPAVAAEGQAFLLVPGDDLAAAPVVAERIASEYCDLDRINLLGGTGAITGDAVTQLAQILPTGTNCPGDPGPGPNPDLPTFGDCTTPTSTTLSNLIGDLAPDSDPDGDGFSTEEETGTFAFDPVVDTARFNPLIADVPEISIELVNDINLELEGTLSQTDSLATTTVNATERTDTTQDIDTTETTETHQVGGEVGASPSGLAGSVNYSYTNSTTNTTGTITTEEFREQNSLAVETSQASTANVDNGRLSFTVGVSNAGHVDFRMEDITINVSRLTSDGRRVPVGAASAEPGFALTEGAPPAELQLMVEDIPAVTALEMARELTGLEFVISTFTLSEIGKGDVRTDAADFSQYQQRVRQNTASIAIDAGPSGQIEQAFVSTTYDRNSDGTPAGTPLCEALRVLLGRTLGVSDEVTGINGSDFPVQVLTSLDQRIGNVDVDFPRNGSENAYWITDVGSASIGNNLPFGLDNVNLRAGDATRLVFYEDRDGDTLDRIREERQLGTSDAEPDSDGDTLGDEAEVAATLTIEVVEPRGNAVAGPYEVRSDPTSANVDGDGWDDARERTEGTDPNRADTDGDGLDDDIDEFPLDGSRGAELVNPLGYWPLDIGDQPIDGFAFEFPNEGAATTREADGTASIPNGSGPIRDRQGQLGRAWAAASPGFEDENGVLRVNAFDDTSNWYGGAFTLAAWVADSSPGGAAERRVIVGEPGYMGLWLSGSGDGTLVLGPLPLSNDVQPNLPAELRYDATDANPLGDRLWTHVAGTAEEVTEGGTAGVRVSLFVDGEQVATAFQAGVTLEETGANCVLMIGNFANNCGGFTGTDTHSGVGDSRTDPQTGLDDVYVFDVALDELQVRELAQDRRPS